MVAESKSGGTMMPSPVTGAASSVSSLSHSLVPSPSMEIFIRVRSGGRRWRPGRGWWRSR
jgi:hypothetical protein